MPLLISINGFYFTKLKSQRFLGGHIGLNNFWLIAQMETYSIFHEKEKISTYKVIQHKKKLSQFVAQVG